MREFRGTSNFINADNLIRLGIISQHSQFNHGAYTALSSGLVSPKENIIDQNTIYITNFGEEFIQACKIK